MTGWRLDGMGPSTAHLRCPQNFAKAVSLPTLQRIDAHDEAHELGEIDGTFAGTVAILVTVERDTRFELATFSLGS